MPAGQVLPYVPSFGEKLTEAIGEGVGHITEGYKQRLQNQQAQNTMTTLQDPNKTAIQKVTAFMNMPESFKKHVSPILGAVLGPQAQSELDTSLLRKLGFLGQEGQQNAPNNQNSNNAQAQQPQNMPQMDQNSQQAPVQPTAKSGSINTSPQNLPGPEWDDANLYKAAALGNQKGPLGVIGNAAKNEIERRQQTQKRFTEERAFHTKGTAPAMESVRKLRSSLPKKESALALAKDAIASGEVGPLSLNNLAQRMGVPEFNTAKGAQLVFAGKENLIGNLSQVAAKAQNQWIEQRFSTMFPQIGQTKEANETITTMLESELKMDQAYLQAFDQIEKQDMEQFGYVKNDIDRRARDQAHEQEKEIINESSYKLREIYEREKGATDLSKNVNQKVVKGTPLTLQNAKVFALKFKGDFDKAIEHAKKMGYRIPTNEEFERWQ